MIIMNDYVGDNARKNVMMIKTMMVIVTLQRTCCCSVFLYRTINR